MRQKDDKTETCFISVYLVSIQSDEFAAIGRRNAFLGFWYTPPCCWRKKGISRSGLSPIGDSVGATRKRAQQRRGNSDGGSKRVATENAVSYHGGIDNRERSLFQGGWTLLRLSSSRVFSLSFLHCAAPLSTLSYPHPRTYLQIGLVILRVHQDNSGLALSLPRERCEWRWRWIGGDGTEGRSN